MVYFSKLHKQALTTLQSKTLAELTDSDLMELLDTLLIRSIAEFRFPRISLDYTEVESGTSSEGSYFNENITQNEINVLLTIMKKLWLKQQLDNEDLFEQKYYDASIRTHSAANMLKELKDRYNTAVKECDIAQYNYSRVDSNASRLSVIYGQDTDE